MNHMDVLGFHRLRTITQLSFESVPQIILQTRILFWMRANPGESFIDVSFYEIAASIFFAALHFLGEIVVIKEEARACKTSVIHYIVTWYNGRFGWVPFTNKLRSAKD